MHLSLTRMCDCVPMHVCCLSLSQAGLSLSGGDLEGLLAKLQRKENREVELRREINRLQSLLGDKARQ